MDPKEIDHIYGESTIKGYDGPFRTKINYAPETEQTLIDTFGFSGDATIQYAEIPKATWVRDVIEIQNMKVDITYDADFRVPTPGDLVKTLWDNSIFEITHVSTAEKIFLGQKLIWSLVLRPYRYDYESSEAEQILFEELEIDDFPDVNISRDKISEKELHRERKIIKEEAAQNDNFDEIDPSVYGYFVDRPNNE